MIETVLVDFLGKNLAAFLAVVTGVWGTVLLVHWVASR